MLTISFADEAHDAYGYAIARLCESHFVVSIGGGDYMLSHVANEDDTVWAWPYAGGRIDGQLVSFPLYQTAVTVL